MWDGHLPVIRELLTLQGDRTVNVRADDEDAFRKACVWGHLDVVQLLLALQGDRFVDVHARNEEAFRSACVEDHLEVVAALLVLEGARAPNPDVVRELGLEDRYHAVRWDRRRAMLAHRTAGQRKARAARAAPC